METIQTTEWLTKKTKSREDLRRFDVTQSPGGKYQLTLV